MKKGEKRLPESWVDTIVYVYTGRDIRKRREIFRQFESNWLRIPSVTGAVHAADEYCHVMEVSLARRLKKMKGLIDTLE